MTSARKRSGAPVGWFRIKDAAAYASVTPRTVSKWLKDGLKHSRLNSNSVLIKIEHVDEYLERFNTDSVDVDAQVAAAMTKARKKLRKMGIR